MRKRSKCASLLLVLLAGVFATGCSIYQPQGFWEVSKTKVDLESKNFKVRKLGAQGNASAPYLFGFRATYFGNGAAVGIPLGNQDVQARAMRQLHQNWDGQGSCFLHNINVEWTTYGIPGLLIFNQNTITADIYEFDSEYVDYAPRY